MPDRRLLISCLAASASSLLLSVFLHSQWTTSALYSDVQAFWARSYVSQGLVPYSSPSNFLEYPPVSGLVLYSARGIGGAIAGAVGGEYAGYYLGFSLLTIAAGVAMAWSTWGLGSRLGVSTNPLYFFLPSLVVYGLYNFDVFNALFIVLALELFVLGRRDLSAVFFSVAIATKLVALVLLPVFLLELTGRRERGRYALVLALVAGASFLPIAAVNPAYFGQFASFFGGWRLEDAWYSWIFQDLYSKAAKEFGLALLALLLLRVYTLKMPLAQKSFLALSSYLLSTPIYAPQFNVMMIPLVAVLALSAPWLYLWEVFNALIIITWFSFPNAAMPWTVPQTMALLRSASLAMLSLSVANGAGHSIVRWMKVRAGLSVQETLA
jgi:hypothetical protein